VTADAREEFVDRLYSAINVARRLDDAADRWGGNNEELSNPERDVWNACALLTQALGKYGIAVRDEFWDALLGGGES